MAYEKKIWISDEVITKEALNNIENGIEAVDKAIPTRTSQLVNDSNFITEHLDLSNYATLQQIHNHTNMEVLNGLTLVRISGWDNAVSKISDLVLHNHDHENINVLNSITDEHILRWDNALHEDALEGFLKDTDMHEHSNLELLENISQIDLNAWDNALQPGDLDAYALKEELHNHENKEVLDQITQELIDKVGQGVSMDDLQNYVSKEDMHGHENLEILNQISEEKIILWDSAIQAEALENYLLKEDSHEHANLAALNKIGNAEINYWNGAVRPEALEAYATIEYVNNRTPHHEFVTEEQWEQLSDEEKNSQDKLYIITDSSDVVIDLSNYVTREEYNTLLARIEELEKGQQ